MKRKSNILKFLLTLSMLPLMGSCVYDTYPEPDLDLKDGVEINLKIIAGGMTTRTSSHTVISKGEEYESAINVSGGDFAIFIFDGPGNYLGRFEPGQILIKNMSTTTVGGVELFSYEISGVFQHGEGVENVQMLILANYQTFGGNYNALEATFESHPGTGGLSDLAYFFSAEADNKFAYSNFTDGNRSWSPQTNPGIPMTALSGVYPVNTKTIDLGPVTALRGLAKIEVVDLAPKDGAKITECKLGGFNNTARFAPLVSSTVNVGWNTQSSLVSTPSLAAAGQDYKAAPLGYVGSTREVVPNKETQKQVRNVYSFYVPEMMLQQGARPTIAVNVEGSNKTFEIQLARYNGEGKPATKDDGSIDYFDYLLRNHLYRFNVLSVGVEADLTLTIDTDYWDNDEDEYFYDDMAVTFAPGKKFKWDWDFDNVDPLDPKFEELGAPRYEDVMQWTKEKLNTDWGSNILAVQKSDESGAFGSFTITAPERGTWTLALYCEESTPNYWFYIERWDDATGQWVREDQRIDPDNEHNYIADTLTGKIARKGEAPKEVKIRIVPKDLQTSPTPYKARLVMNVTTFDGRMAEVNLLTGEMYPANTPESAKQYYYIIQYPIADQ